MNALLAWNTLRNDLIEPKIREHGGRLVDLAGDAVFVEFPSAVEAVSWALDLQRRGTDADTPAPGCELRLRIGINVGDLLVDDGRLVGDGVNIASRIHQVALPGDIVVTEAVRQHVHQRISVRFRDLGEQQFKNISRPIRVYRVEAERLQAPASMDAYMAGRPTRALLALDISKPGTMPDGGQLDVAADLRRLKDLIAREVLPTCGGRLVRQGDGGLLIDFPEARPAVKAAFAIRRACRASNAGVMADQASLPRMGLQMGEALADETDLYGSGADVATRLTAIAEPGGILVSAAVRNGLTSVLDADIEDLGERYLEDMNQPVRVYRLEPPGTRPEVEPGGAADELRPTIAVIPFTERGEGHEPLGEILAEEVIAALSHSAELNVVSRLSTTAFRGRGATLVEVSAHLKANYVLSGTYRVAMGSLVLAAELADTRTARVAWASDLKGSVAGIIDGQDELIDRVVAEVSRAVMARELERTQSQSLQTLETCTLLMSAITLMHRLSLSDFQRARQMLLTVAQRAPRHAIPQAWLAKWHVLRVWQSWSEDPTVDTRLAQDFSQRALDNDSHCSLALAIDGFVQTNLLKALDVAQERYELALQVNPNDSLAWLLSGTLHAFKGEGRPAVKATQHALRLSPLDPHRYFYDALAASAELSAGRYDRAIALARRSLRANRLHASTFRALAIAQWQSGHEQDARKTVVELMKVEPLLTVRSWLQRSPSSDYPIGIMCANALRCAGVPD